MTIAAGLLSAWSEVFSSPVITELAPGRVWEVATERGDRQGPGLLTSLWQTVEDRLPAAAVAEPATSSGNTIWSRRA